MYNEIRKNKTLESESVKMADINEDVNIIKFTGEVLDYAIHPDGTRELIRHDHNLIVNDCSVLIAILMKQEVGYVGLQYWAVGAGSDLWPNDPVTSPGASDAQLTNETYRKAIDPLNDIVYLDDSNVLSLTPTHKIQITVTFEEAEANGELREFGIFGGNASASLNSGVMINHKIHPLIYKTSALRLERILRLTF